MKFSGMLRRCIQTLKAACNETSSKRWVMALEALEEGAAPPVFDDINGEPEVLSLVDQWKGLTEISFDNMRCEFIILVALPGMLNALVKLGHELPTEKINTVFSHYSTLSATVFDSASNTSSAFFPELFSVLWAANEALPSPELSHEVVDWLMNLTVIKTFRFLGFSSVISEILRNNDAYFMQRLYEMQSQFVSSSVHGDSRLLFTKMIELGDYTGLEAGVQYVVEHTDFNIGAYYDHSSSQFKELELVKAFIEKPAIKTSRYLAYLFAPERTAEELTSGPGKPPALLHDPATLITELTTRYQHHLKEFSKPDLSELDHKRMKRLRDLLKQIPVAEQAGLISPYLSLAILKCTRDTYANRNQFRTLLGGKGNIKRDFLQVIIQDFSRKIINDQLVTEEIQLESHGAIWNAYVAAFRAQPKDMNAVNRWLQNDILVGYDTQEALSWLPEEYLQSIAKNTVLMPQGKTIKLSLAEAAEQEGLTEKQIPAEEFMYSAVDAKAAPTNTSIWALRGLSLAGASVRKADAGVPSTTPAYSQSDT